MSALCALAYAGPEQYSSGKEMKEVVPVPPPPCPSWTGFYIGGFGGYKFASTDTDINLGGEFNIEPIEAIEDKAAVEANSPNDLDTSGFELGGLIGYNYQFHNNWIVGLEASGGYLWLRDSNSTEFLSESGTTFSEATSLKTHYLVTVAPRIGYAFCRWFPYVTGGLAIGDIDFSQSIRDLRREDGMILPLQNIDGRPFLAGSKSETNLGWMVGAGVQYAVTNHWSVRGQYQYIDLGSVDFDSRLDGDPTALTGPTTRLLWRSTTSASR